MNEQNCSSGAPEPGAKHIPDVGHPVPSGRVGSIGNGRTSHTTKKRRNGRIPPASRTKWERTNG